MNNLKFHEPLNTAVITNKKIIQHLSWIGYVSHDAEDGAWQFLELNREQDIKDAAVISLKEIIAIDSSILELADLPLGWHAWRKTKESPWTREKMQ